MEKKKNKAGAKKKGVTKLKKGKPYRKSVAAKKMGVSRPTVDHMIQDGRLTEKSIVGIIVVERA